MIIIMPNPSLNHIERNVAEDNIIKDIRNLFKLRKKKDNDIKDKIIRDIRFLLETEEGDYYEPIRTCNAFDDNFIEHESKGDKNKIVSIEEYLNGIKRYLSKMINDHKIQGEQKIQFNYMSSKRS